MASQKNPRHRSVSSSLPRRNSVSSRRARSFATASPVDRCGSWRPSRGSVDDLARSVARECGATIGLHRFSLTQLAARLAAPVLADARLAPATYLGSEAVAARAAFEAQRDGRARLFRPGRGNARLSTRARAHAAGAAAGARGRADTRRACRSAADLSVLLRAIRAAVRGGVRHRSRDALRRRRPLRVTAIRRRESPACRCCCWTCRFDSGSSSSSSAR